MRILLTSDLFHPLIGGAERQVRLLAAELARRGHGVMVATTLQPGLATDDVVDDVPVKRLPALATSVPWFSGDAARRFLPPLPDPRLVLGLRRLTTAWPVDVIHASGWIAYASAAAVADGRAPMVLSVRDYGHACATRNLLQRDRVLCDGPRLAKCLECAGRHYGAAKALIAVGGVRTGRPLLRRTVRGIHSVSRFVEMTVRRDLVGDDVGWEPILERIPDVVPSPAPGGPAMLRPEEQALIDSLPTEPFILFVGALQAHKGLSVLLRAYRRLDGGAARVPPLVLIGTRWPETPDSFPLGVRVLSDVPHAVVMAAWERSLFGVAPSIWPDPLPGVVREAMTRGRAVVATAVGGNLDMMDDEESGLLVPPGDVAALARAMQRLIDHPELRDRLGAAGQTSVAGLTAAVVAERFEALYARCLEDGP